MCQRALSVKGKIAHAVPVDEDIVESEFEDEDLELLLHLQVGLLCLFLRKDVKGRNGGAIHLAGSKECLSWGMRSRMVGSGNGKSGGG